MKKQVERFLLSNIGTPAGEATLATPSSCLLPGIASPHANLGYWAFTWWGWHDSYSRLRGHSAIAGLVRGKRTAMAVHYCSGHWLIAATGRFAAGRPGQRPAGRLPVRGLRGRRPAGEAASWRIRWIRDPNRGVWRLRRGKRTSGPALRGSHGNSGAVADRR